MVGSGYIVVVSVRGVFSSNRVAIVVIVRVKG